MHQAAFILTSPPVIDRVYGHGRRERVAQCAELYPTIITPQNFDEHREQLARTQVIFSTWSMFEPTEQQLDAMGQLQAVFYAAGSVQRFARPFLERDILVVTAAAMNAIPVAEFTLAQIILANKGYWHNMAACATPEGRAEAGSTVGPGNYGQTVGLLGAGAIGRLVIDLLKPLELNVLVWDPFLSEEQADRLGVEKVDDLPEVFERANVISNHLANKEEIRGLIDRACFERMGQGTTFINTGRGAQINEADLAAVFEARPDLTALLDVTMPEPPEADSAFYRLPNVHLTSHIAGSLNQEVLHMADFVIDQYQRWAAGDSPEGRVTLEMLATMA